MVSPAGNDRYDRLSNFRIQSEGRALRQWGRVFRELGRPKSFERGAELMRQSDELRHVYYVVRGFTEYSYVDALGEEHLIDIMSFGSILGLLSLYSDDNLIIGNLKALTQVDVLELSAMEMMRLSRRDQELGRELLEEMSRIAGALAMQSYSRSASATTRLSGNLFMMAEAVRRQYQYEGEDWATRRIEITISQEDLARISHTTRVTASKTIRDLRSLGLVDTEYRKFVILDLEGLRALVESMS